MVNGIDLKVDRIRAGVFQQDLAIALGISRQTLINWERTPNIPAHKAVAYREALERLSEPTAVEVVA
jgi:DNA-binding XRE family transcriptional regulator